MNKKYMNRVELHCHTGFSINDGTASVRDIVDFAVSQGMTSAAFTDHGNVMAYPEIQRYCESKEGFKPIYGMEGYVVNDIDLLGMNLADILDVSIDTDVVVIDLETTGFSPLSEEIIEIGAVKIVNGQLADIFQTFVKPTKSIPGAIHTLTGIDDLLVKDADSIDVVLSKLLEFIGDSIVVAHNATFDLGFIEENALELEIPFSYRCIDTVALSRVVFPEIAHHTLDAVMKACGVAAQNHHRAVDDAQATAQSYLKMIEMLTERGHKTIGDIIDLLAANDDVISKCPTYHITILARNIDGIHSLYRLVTDSNLKYFNKRPRIKLSNLLADRENLIIGSACEAGLLGHAIRPANSSKNIEKIASIYDYLEIQPTDELRWMLKSDNEDNINSEDDIRAYSNRIIELGKKLHKPVVAVGDVHYLRHEDSISRCVLKEHLHFKNPKDDDYLYFRTTDEMLDEFSYLGEEKAYEIVVENPNKIAEQIEYIKPLDYKRASYNREEDFERLKRLCYEGLKKRCGEQAAIENVFEDVRIRLNKELAAVNKNENAYYYLWLYDLIHINKLNPSQYNLRGSSASLFINFLLGISHTNPLDPEMPLYSEFFIGINEDKYPDIDMNVDSKVWENVIETSKSLPGIKTAYRAGMISTMADISNCMIEAYEEFYGKLTEEEKIIAINDLSSTAYSKKLHPGGMIMIPEGADEVTYSPLDMDEKRNEISFQFNYYSVDHIFDKVDILKHDACTLNARLYEATGYYPTDEDIKSEEIMSLVTSCEGLGIPQGKNYGIKSGVLAIPGFMNEFMLMLIDILQPKTYSELVRLEGVSHGTNTWLENGEILVADGKATIASMIGSREDVFETMLAHGIDRKTAFAIAEDVRKGKMCMGRMNSELRQAMFTAGVPEWYIWSCEKVRYLFPRAHAAEYVQMELRILYYKLHYPEVFYPLFFDIYGTEKFKKYYSMGIDGLDAMNYYLMTDKSATIEDMYFYKTWNEYRLRKTL